MFSSALLAGWRKD